MRVRRAERRARFQVPEAVGVVHGEVQGSGRGPTSIGTHSPAGGGQSRKCGWLKDKYGLSWQIVPTAMLKYLTDKDPAKSPFHAGMMTVKKIDIAAIEKAHAVRTEPSATAVSGVGAETGSPSTG